VKFSDVEVPSSAEGTADARRDHAELDEPLLHSAIDFALCGQADQDRPMFKSHHVPGLHRLRDGGGDPNLEIKSEMEFIPLTIHIVGYYEPRLRAW
jgi:hypothetical protein